MKSKLPYLTIAAASLVILFTGCSILKDLVKKTGEAVVGVIGVPENVVTNSYSQAKSALTPAPKAAH